MNNFFEDFLEVLVFILSMALALVIIGLFAVFMILPIILGAELGWPYWTLFLLFITIPVGAALLYTILDQWL